jgi:hypothetical protein
MTRISERKQLINDLEFAIKVMAADGGEETKDFEEVAETVVELEENRYLDTRVYLRKNKDLCDLLWRFSEFDFRQQVRMTKPSFLRLVDLIKEDPIFSNESLHKQAPVWMQVMVTIQVLGLDGTGASVGRTARTSGFGHGTVVKFKNRVISALLRLRKRFIFWPKEDERKVRI